MAIDLLAAGAVALVAPYLGKVGEAAAGKLGEASVAAAGKVVGWLRDKLGGSARDALESLEKAPDSEGRKLVLQEELSKALAADPKLAEELRAMLPPEALEGGAMIQNVSGTGAKAAQVRGDRNDVKIG